MSRSKSTVICSYPPDLMLLFPTGLLLAGLLTGCGTGAESPDLTVADSAGVAVVTTAGEDRALDWTAERIFTLSPLAEEGDGFFGVQEVEVLAGGRIAILDDDAKRVVLYDESGGFLAQYGREGSGPGEFQMPFEMAPTPEGGVAVYDVINRRLERFDSALQPLAPDPMQVEYYGGRLAYAGPFLVVPTRSLGDPEANLQGLLAMGPGDTVEIVEYERDPGKVMTLESCGLSFSGMGPLFEARTMFATGSHGTVAVVGTDGYEVDLYRQPDFALERRIRRDVPVIHATKEIAAAVGDGMRIMAGGQERVCDAGEVAAQRGFMPRIPPIADLAIAPSGEIYLQRWAQDETDRSIDVLSPTGEYLGTLPPGFPFPQAFLGDDRIVVTEEDELGMISVVVYRLER